MTLPVDDIFSRLDFRCLGQVNPSRMAGRYRPARDGEVNMLTEWHRPLLGRLSIQQKVVLKPRFQRPFICIYLARFAPEFPFLLKTPPLQVSNNPPIHRAVAPKSLSRSNKISTRSLCLSSYYPNYFSKLSL